VGADGRLYCTSVNKYTNYEPAEFHNQSKYENLVDEDNGAN